MATQTMAKQSVPYFRRSVRKLDLSILLNVLILLLCFESILCVTDYCKAGGKCEFDHCICTDESVECHNETKLKVDVVDLFPCIQDDVKRVIITGSPFPELMKNFLGSCHADSSLRLKKLTLLDLSGNKIRRIHGKSLHCMPILETLILAHNDWMIDYHTEQTGYFSSLPNLMHLDLTNAFDEVWNGTIHFSKLVTVFYETDMTKLQTLLLAQNEMFTLSEHAVNSLCVLTSLKTLDFSHNKLSVPALPTVMERRCLEDLESLDLSYNKMPRLPSEFMTKLEKMTSLKEVYLGYNDYMCDCTLLETYNWLVKTKVPIHDLDHILCTDGYHSSYINKTVLELRPEDLKCLQLPAPSSKAVRVVTGVIFTVIAVTMVAFLVVHRARVRSLCVKWQKRLPSMNLRSHSGYNTVQEVAHV